jgi:hypothetical protein
MKAICLATALLALPSARSDTRERREERLAQVLAYAGAPVDSVRYRGTDSWEALGDHSLLLWETRQRAYFVDVQPTCDEFPWANAIVVDFRNLTLDSKFDSILVGGRHCRIEEIRPVDVKALKAAERQARRDDDDD